jgi:hypothetical protein
MAKSWMNTLKKYFSMLNQLQIEGDATELAAYRANDEVLSKEVGRIKRGRDSLIERKATPLKCKTTIRNIRILNESNNRVHLALQNHLWKLYHINNNFCEQEEEQYRYITLSQNESNWLIEQDSLLGEEGLRPEEEEIDASTPQDTDEESYGFKSSKGPYHRARAKRYAELWWNQYNPSYPKFDVDCTNFVSQCLHEGGLSMETTGQREKGWWVQGKTNWSFSWSVANSLMNYLVNGKQSRAELKSSADQLTIGDLICYDWEGRGRFEHNTFVVAKDPYGMPLVNAHTINSRHRYWEYRDSHAWTPNTQYKFMHIKD